ncbi:MAG: hypothetical protein EZS28_056061 [Streblomastix strix]|uniref:Uncharacterized protein n=1 Tax=Streblomastix strix TaxID=222440 RepID=A0A5J4PSS7_9EUKA|nr:MAG: hypothetical protein EZS28_056061 [Streblomastix strix]
MRKLKTHGGVAHRLFSDIREVCIDTNSISDCQQTESGEIQQGEVSNSMEFKLAANLHRQQQNTTCLSGTPGRKGCRSASESHIYQK